MSWRGRATYVPLKRMSEKQIGIVRETVLELLVAKASDLHLARDGEDSRRVVGEVAALGRLAFWLEHDQVRVPDPDARALVARVVEDLDEWDLGLLECYEEAVARHDPMRPISPTSPATAPRKDGEDRE